VILEMHSLFHVCIHPCAGSRTGLFLRDVGLDEFALNAYLGAEKKAVEWRHWTQTEALPAANRLAEDVKKRAGPAAERAREYAHRAADNAAVYASWAAGKVKYQHDSTNKIIHSFVLRLKSKFREPE